MAKRKVYTEEFKQQAVRLVRVERQPSTRVARDLGVSESSLYGWVAKGMGVTASVATFISTQESN